MRYGIRWQMKVIAVVGVLLGLFHSVVKAQPPTMEGPALTFTYSDPGPGAIATYAAVIFDDGRVMIDWESAEKIALNPGSTDKISLTMVRLMLAVRDGAWEPMQGRPPK